MATTLACADRHNELTRRVVFTSRNGMRRSATRSTLYYGTVAQDCSTSHAPRRAADTRVCDLNGRHRSH